MTKRLNGIEITWFHLDILKAFTKSMPFTFIYRYVFNMNIQEILHRYALNIENIRQVAEHKTI